MKVTVESSKNLQSTLKIVIEKKEIDAKIELRLTELKNKWGRIINIASTHGLIGSLNKSAYTASKHGLVGLTKVTALETAEDPITCNSLCPGFVLTELIQDQIQLVAKSKNIPTVDAGVEMLRDKQPSLKFVKKEDIASIAYFLCSKESDQITGTNISLDGAWTAQ